MLFVQGERVIVPRSKNYLRRKLSHLLLLAGLCRAAVAHPEPDIPVRSSFGPDGHVTIRVEVDPRCFTRDPLNEPYLENASMQALPEGEKTELFSKAARFISEFIEFRALPMGMLRPEFKMKFTTFQNKELVWNAAKPAENAAAVAQTPVVITAEWKVDASSWTGYQIKSSSKGKLGVQFINDLNGKSQALNVLFPGEESYTLDLIAWAKGIRLRPANAPGAAPVPAR
jgi:hypothetical protein